MDLVGKQAQMDDLEILDLPARTEFLDHQDPKVNVESQVCKDRKELKVTEE